MPETKRFVDDISEYAIDDPDGEFGNWEIDEDIKRALEAVDENLRYARIRARDIIIG